MLNRLSVGPNQFCWDKIVAQKMMVVEFLLVCQVCGGGGGGGGGG